MIGLGSAIGAGVSAIGSIFGGISASKAMKKVKKNIEAQQRKNQDWYDRRYNEDAIQRADAQSAITEMQNRFRDGLKRAEGSQAVMGGSEESVAAAKAANNSAMADVMSNVAVNGERRKDVIESQYQTKDEALQQQLNDMEINKANQTSQAIQGVASAASELGKMF